MLWPVWHILWPIAPDIMAGEQTSILATLTLKLSVSRRAVCHVLTIAQENITHG